MRRALLTLAFLAVPAAALQAQREDARERLDRGGYAAVVRNRSGCNLTIDRANTSVPAANDGLVFLSHDIFDAVNSDGQLGAIPPREIRVDGRVAARVNSASHLEVYVSSDCSVTVYTPRKAELLANLDQQIRSLEDQRSSDRRGRLISGTLAALSFGAAAYFSGSDSDEAGTYTAVSAGAGLGFLLGGFTGSLFDDGDRRQLALYQRWREALTRSF